MSVKLVYFVALLFGSVLVAEYDTTFRHGETPKSAFANLWGYSFPVILVIWITEDSKSQPHVYQPFELALLFWVPYLPYYLRKTRGSKGLATTAALFSAGLPEPAVHARRRSAS